MPIPKSSCLPSRRLVLLRRRCRHPHPSCSPGVEHRQQKRTSWLHVHLPLSLELGNILEAGEIDDSFHLKFFRLTSKPELSRASDLLAFNIFRACFASACVQQPVFDAARRSWPCQGPHGPAPALAATQPPWPERQGVAQALGGFPGRALATCSPPEQRKTTSPNP